MREDDEAKNGKAKKGKPAQWITIAMKVTKLERRSIFATMQHATEAGRKAALEAQPRGRSVSPGKECIT